MLDHLGLPSVLLLDEEGWTPSIIIMNSHNLMNDDEWEAAKNCVLHQMDEMRAHTMEHQAIERLDIQDSQEIAQPVLGPSEHSGMTLSSDLSSENPFAHASAMSPPSPYVAVSSNPSLNLLSHRSNLSSERHMTQLQSYQTLGVTSSSPQPSNQTSQ